MSIYCNIHKDFHNFQLHIEFQGDNEVLSLLGASGSGKSMILRCIAGIEKPDSGKIVVDDHVLFDSESKINLSPQERKVGLLFQDYALFPNMTAAENIAIAMDKTYPLSLSQVLASYHLTEQQHQYPHQLSGGQRQRCAIARMIVTNPTIILLDEPFSALDSFLRFQLEKELFRDLSNYHKTIIFVSHNRDEVYRLSDKVSVIKDGHNLPMVEKHELFNHPTDYESAVLTGCKNILSIEHQGSAIIVPALQITLDMELAPSSATNIIANASEYHYVGIHAHDFFYIQDSIYNSDTTIAFPFTIQDTDEGLHSYYLTVKPQGAISTILVEIPKEQYHEVIDSIGLIGVEKKRLKLLS